MVMTLNLPHSIVCTSNRLLCVGSTQEVAAVFLWLEGVSHRSYQTFSPETWSCLHFGALPDEGDKNIPTGHHGILLQLCSALLLGTLGQMSWF
jgi:hypothetical protein